MWRSCGFWLSSEAVLAFDFGRLESADARMHARPGGHDERKQNLVGAGSVADANFHRVKMAADVGCIDVSDRNIEPSAGPPDFLRGGNDGFCIAENLAHRVSPGNMPQRAVLQFASGADDCAFTVAFDRFRVSAQPFDKRARHLHPEGLQVVHKALDPLLVPAGIGVMNYHESGSAALRCGSHRAALVENFLDNDDSFPYLNLRHEPTSYREQDSAAGRVTCGSTVCTMPRNVSAAE